VAMFAMLVLALAPGLAQAFSTADLEGTWKVTQLSTPPGALTGADVRSFSGLVSFDANGAVSGASVIAENIGGGSFIVGGNLSVSAGGIVNGTLVLTTLDDEVLPSGTLVIREARLLANRFTLVGAANILGQVGLFTFVKQDDAQTFTIADDLGGDWNYHELTPSNNLSGNSTASDAAWITGSITFHADSGCTEADLVLSDGTVRAQREVGDPNSFN
jgi:hypothetical protein